MAMVAATNVRSVAAAAAVVLSELIKKKREQRTALKIFLSLQDVFCVSFLNVLVKSLLKGPMRNIYKDILA